MKMVREAVWVVEPVEGALIPDAEIDLVTVYCPRGSAMKRAVSSRLDPRRIFFTAADRLS
jgi:hypothetical protein